jgi:NADPH-dependent glutamate synthase beta subunit-like oxidoreductase
MASPSRRNVAVVGGGPAGLSCAFALACKGHTVTLYDHSRPGGVPRASIPSFRLPDEQLRNDIDFLSRFFAFREQRVDAHSLGQLRHEYDAVFLSPGLGIDRPAGIPGERLAGVFPLLPFLATAKENPAGTGIGKNVAVIGGGNTSLDAATTARRCGAERVSLLYRRSQKEMRVWTSELEEARKAGVEFQFLVHPIEFMGRDRVEGIRCLRNRLGEERDSTGRPIPIPIQGSEFTLPADSIVIAIGQTTNADFLTLVRKTPGGYVEVDAGFNTSLPGVFAGGDIVGGEGTIVQAVAHGKSAAEAIHSYLERKAS